MFMVVSRHWIIWQWNEMGNVDRWGERRRLPKKKQTHLVGGWDSSVSPPRSVAPSASLPLPPSLSLGLWLPPAPAEQTNSIRVVSPSFSQLTNTFITSDNHTISVTAVPTLMNANHLPKINKYDQVLEMEIFLGTLVLWNDLSIKRLRLFVLVEAQKGLGLFWGHFNPSICKEGTLNRVQVKVVAAQKV